VEHGDPVSNARDRLPMIEADTEAFQAILEHEHLTADQPFTDQQLVTINEDYKQMQAIDLQPAVDGYRFSVLVPKPAAPSANERASGVVSPLGQVTIEQRAPGVRPNCPICLAGGVLIDTASGAVPVQDIRAGMRVWTTDAGGRRVVAVVDEVGHVLAPMGHEVVRVVLGDGRIVTASPGHPTADGRTVGELRPGDVLDGSEVVSASLIAYAGAATYDLLPSGPTGTYFANGILLGSTLRRIMADVPGAS